MKTKIEIKNNIKRLSQKNTKNTNLHIINSLPEIVFISTFPPKVCGIATYTQDLIGALKIKFGNSFKIRICPIETQDEDYTREEKPLYSLNTSELSSFIDLARQININPDIEFVVLQHEFGLFNTSKRGLSLFLHTLLKKLMVTFHTVLPKPSEELKLQVQEIADHANSIIVMTDSSANILIKDYEIYPEKITVIPHGTHLLPLTSKKVLKAKYNLSNKKVLSTFGLLGSGKNLETTLRALPEIIKENPNVIFLIIGKTHPSIIKNEGEKYREYLEKTIADLQLEQYVRFVNNFVPLEELLEYLQLTDVYLFTSKDRNQAVSGTFSYAISCGCPIVSTPIPHAQEVLTKEVGIIIDFESPTQLSNAVNKILSDEKMQEQLSNNALEKMALTAWENSSISHGLLFQKHSQSKIELLYSLPEINLTHIKNMTTDFGMIQFAKINKPDIESGYTLDDNARALIAMCQLYEKTKEKEDLTLINIYLNFIKYCQQADGSFLNYINKEKKFTQQNNETNLEDSNGRAIWALGYLISKRNIFEKSIIKIAEEILEKNLPIAEKIYSTRAMAFMIKGLYYENSKKNQSLLNEFASRLVKMYQHEATKNWQWFESYLTYGNSVLPEAILCAWVSTGNENYKNIAIQSFDFLLSKIFMNGTIKVITNKGWHIKHNPLLKTKGGEQPIDVAYTILALSKFYNFTNDKKYLELMHQSFHWFLGKNYLQKTIYNPATGGCYDGLEEHNVNLNQGAESTISYLMARLCFKTII